LRHFAIGIALLAAGFAAGAVFGYRVIGKPYWWLGTIGRSWMANQYAMTQYRDASYPDARLALEAYIAHLDSSKPMDDPCIAGAEPWLDSRGLRFDKTFAWVRLAMLHENNGRAEEAEKAWRRADELVAQGNWKDKSRQHFRELIARMDRRHSAPVEPAASEPRKDGGV
jgi:hypothetical protein